MGSSDGSWDAQLSCLVGGFHVVSMKAAYPSKSNDGMSNHGKDSNDVSDRNVNTKIANCW